jgi:hypothetical protein
MKRTSVTPARTPASGQFAYSLMEWTDSTGRLRTLPLFLI